MQSHKAWLSIAHSDLIDAIVLFKASRFNAVMYHCQQSVEKSLKGYLAYKKQLFHKTHDLAILIKLCTSFDRHFLSFLEYSNDLKVYVTLGRYPGDAELPEIKEIEIALKHAQEVLDYVQKNT